MDLTKFIATVNRSNVWKHTDRKGFRKPRRRRLIRQIYLKEGSHVIFDTRDSTYIGEQETFRESELAYFRTDIAKYVVEMMETGHCEFEAYGVRRQDRRVYPTGESDITIELGKFNAQMTLEGPKFVWYSLDFAGQGNVIKRSPMTASEGVWEQFAKLAAYK